MAAVQQRILNWLYSVLTSEYQDVNRTYNDVANALSHYSSLNPRTEVYTYENGSSALLLQLSGTLPVAFRGTTYRFPVTLWIPHAYPTEAPLVYVTPTEGMMVRAGQHVDPQGKVYHPYLVGWAEFWDKSNVLDFLAILRDVFAKEPPVVARQRIPPANPTQQGATPPPIPPLPSTMARPASQVSTDGLTRPAPPPPPPKQLDPSRAQSPGSYTQDRGDGGPPLPPLPPGVGRPPGQGPPPVPPYQNGPGNQPLRQSSIRYENAPPLPPQLPPQQSRPQSYGPSTIDPRRPQLYMQSPPPQGYPPQQQQYSSSGPSNMPPSYGPPPQGYPNQPQQYQQYATPQQPLQQQQPLPKAPVPDLIDEPLTLALPTQANLPAPPIPPNPEKDMILHTLARALHAQRLQTASQTPSSLPGLSAQNTALLSSLKTMQAELAQLTNLQQTFNSNTSILHTALHDADALISKSQHKPPPGIDEILVAPTVVGNQLYELVAEERALGDALFVLGRAVERGRVTGGMFVKSTRGLAREWFLKKALVRKIGVGMGLDV